MSATKVVYDVRTVRVLPSHDEERTNTEAKGGICVLDVLCREPDFRLRILRIGAIRTVKSILNLPSMVIIAGFEALLL